MDPLQTLLPLKRLCGLRPDVWLCVGAGFAREEVKALVLSQGKGFTGDAILTLQEICLKVTGISSDKLLTSPARQEVLRLLLAEPRISESLPELKIARRQRNFLRRLDAAMQTGRIAFAHAEEEEVYHERLIQSLGPNLLRSELQALSKAYEIWLEAEQWFDLPMLFHQTLKTLDSGWPKSIRKCSEIWVLSVQNPESLEKEIWDRISQFMTVRWIHTLADTWDIQSGPLAQGETEIRWQNWHTLDDAAEYFAEEISLVLQRSDRDSFDWTQYAVLIPDVPSVRRSLRRALELRGVPVADPRDPTRLRWDESLKWALLPLEVVGRNFERQTVVSWLRSYGGNRREMSEDFSTWTQEINSRGVRNGISGYAGGILTTVYAKLVDLRRQLGGRKTISELSQNHLKILREKIDSDSIWIISFFEQTWEVFRKDMERVGLAEKRAPLLFWLERLQTRLREASPPIDRLKPKEGLGIYRLQQAPMRPVKSLWIFGLPQNWLKGDGTGSYWFTEREREILATEFAVRSSVQVHDERLNILSSWIKGSSSVVFLDSHYEVDGRERESILPILKELELSLGMNLPDVREEMGAHPRFSKSYEALRPVQPQEIQLPPLTKGPGGQGPALTATAIERYSRCGFQALAYHRWNLRDIREPDTELWPDVKGNILHEAVRILLKAMDPKGRFAVLPKEALERAWRAKRPKGLIRSERVENYVKSRLILVLEAFCEKEREYVQRSGTTPISLEDDSFEIEFPDFSIVGQPDRIDRHPEGLFIMDYKTSGTVPHGTEMIERGYRLQLPFYAIATRKKTSEAVIGVQFVELDRRGSRKSGVFFKEYNGKDKGSLTQVRPSSKSLVSQNPDDVWNLFEDYVFRSADSLLKGKFEAMPRTEKREKECTRCRVADICGFRRLVEPDVNGVPVSE